MIPFTLSRELAERSKGVFGVLQEAHHIVFFTKRHFPLASCPNPARREIPIKRLSNGSKLNKKKGFNLSVETLWFIGGADGGRTRNVTDRHFPHLKKSKYK